MEYFIILILLLFIMLYCSNIDRVEKFTTTISGSSRPIFGPGSTTPTPAPVPSHTSSTTSTSSSPTGSPTCANGQPSGGFPCCPDGTPSLGKKCE
jgi:hypothetical protein